MNNTADSVQEVKSHQNLPGDFFDQIEWKSFVIVSFQNLKQVDTQDFENHTEVISIRAFVKERVQ